MCLYVFVPIVPVANIGSTISFPLILIGVLFSWNQTLINIGILAFSLALIFQLVTLPVEFNASRRALSILSEGGLLTEEEVPMARKFFCAALRSAALSTFYNFYVWLFYLVATTAETKCRKGLSITHKSNNML